MPGYESAKETLRVSDDGEIIAHYNDVILYESMLRNVIAMNTVRDHKRIHDIMRTYIPD